QTLDAGSWKDSSFNGIKVPTLAEAMLLAQMYNKKLYLNMKVFAPHLVANVLAQTGVAPNTIILDPGYISEVQQYHQLMPNTPLAYFGAPPSDINDTNFYNTLYSNGVISAEIPADYFVDSAWVSQYKLRLNNKGIELWAYTVNKAEYMRSLKTYDFDGLETDRPTQAKEIFCTNNKEFYYPEKRISGQWDFDSTLLGTKGSQLSYIYQTPSNLSKIQFATCDSFHIPRIENVNINVAKINALDSNEALRFYSNFFPEGRPSASDCNNSYTIIFDFLKPHTDTGYISLLQTSNNNSDDGDLFIRNSDNSIGILGQYDGTLVDSTWNRLAVVFDLNQDKMDKYLNGSYIGTTLIPDALNGRFCINNNWGVQSSNFFSDNDNETSALFVSSIQIRNYAMSQDELSYLGGVSSSKISDTIFINQEECPVIISQSNDTIITQGSNIKLYVETTDSVNYRWQINKGIGWDYISEVNVTDIGADTITISNVQDNLDQVLFRCKINNDCSIYSDEIKISVSPATYIKENTNLFASVYPNPSNGNFFVSLYKSYEPVFISLYNSAGIKMYSQEIKETPSKISLNLNTAGGVCFMQLQTSKSNEVKKIIILED
ncbi:MAG: T9SS type A sorting domain-containing protein, partial [Bacteroidetes bacterium]|nr:T9SS type A sorting domain-containing protein [Bacteroidota bacterium]